MRTAERSSGQELDAHTSAWREKQAQIAAGEAVVLKARENSVDRMSGWKAAQRAQAGESTGEAFERCAVGCSCRGRNLGLRLDHLNAHHKWPQHLGHHHRAVLLQRQGRRRISRMPDIPRG